YVAFPGGMMAALWGRPLVVFEPGAVAGISNRVLAPVADRVVVGMEGSFDKPVAQRWANALPKPRRVEWLGTPVREEIAALPPPEERPQIVHQSGDKLYAGLRAAYDQAGVKAEVVPFLDDMAARYAWCDVL